MGSNRNKFETQLTTFLSRRILLVLNINSVTVLSVIRDSISWQTLSVDHDHFS